MAELKVDVAVVGSGAMGAMCAWSLTRRGATVALVERYVPGHARGASHGGSRIFRTLCPEGAQYAELARSSLARITELERLSGTRLFRRTGGLVIGEAGEPRFEQVRRVAAETGVDHEVLSPDGLADRHPQHEAARGSSAIYEAGAGVLDPEGVVTAAVAESSRSGAHLLAGTTVQRVAACARGVRVLTDQGVVDAGAVVVAAGAWSHQLPGLGDLPLTSRRSVLTWYQPREDADAYAADTFPVFLRYTPGLSGWGTPLIEGDGVKVGLLGDTATKVLGADPDRNYQLPPTRAEIAPVDAFVQAALRGLRPAAVRAEPCLDSRTPDKHFLIDRHPRLPAAVIAAGFSGHGFKHCGAVGDAAAQLALGERPDHDLTSFGLDRFGL